MAAISAFVSHNIARFFHISLQIEFNALRFIIYTISRICSTYAMATLSVEVFDNILKLQSNITINSLHAIKISIMYLRKTVIPVVFVCAI